MSSCAVYLARLGLALAGCGQLPLLRPQVEDYRWETLNHSGHPMTRDQLHGFLSGLMVAGTLSPEQIHALSQRLNKGQAAGWM